MSRYKMSGCRSDFSDDDTIGTTTTTTVTTGRGLYERAICHRGEMTTATMTGVEVFKRRESMLFPLSNPVRKIQE